MSDEAILHVDSVGKRYGHRRVLTSATLSVFPGMIYALLGRNGAGKSTLLKIAGGIIQPDSGFVKYRGRMRERNHLTTLARAGLFYLPDFDLLARSLSIRDQLTAVHRTFGGSSPEDMARRFRLDEHLDTNTDLLSGGETRRAEVALAVQRNPKCLLADEPFRGIAPIDVEFLGTEFKKIANDGCAVVLTGHQVPELLAIADEVIWCTAGTTYALGHPLKAQTNERFMRDFLGYA